MASQATAALRHQLATLRSRIFSTAPPPPLSHPGGIRTGAKILTQRLVGPSMLKYYGPTINMRTARPDEEASDGSEGPFMTTRENQRLLDVARKRRIGKGPPKKGQGRRAALKTKKR
ncbi:unnamed protein product [Parajaminaea phylloscopi]